MVVLILIKILNKIFDKNKLFAQRHPIKVLPEIEYLLLRNCSPFYDDDIFEFLLSLLIFRSFLCQQGQKWAFILLLCEFTLLKWCILLNYQTWFVLFILFIQWSWLFKKLFTEPCFSHRIWSIKRFILPNFY